MPLCICSNRSPDEDAAHSRSLRNVGDDNMAIRVLRVARGSRVGDASPGPRQSFAIARLRWKLCLRTLQAKRNPGMQRATAPQWRLLRVRARDGALPCACQNSAMRSAMSTTPNNIAATTRRRGRATLNPRDAWKVPVARVRHRSGCCLHRRRVAAPSTAHQTSPRTRRKGSLVKGHPAAARGVNANPACRSPAPKRSPMSRPRALPAQMPPRAPHACPPHGPPPRGRKSPGRQRGSSPRNALSRVIHH